jgi:hypothetical protein
MKLVFIHGMRQEGKHPAEIMALWRNTLEETWNGMGLSFPKSNVVMPFYGDELDRLTRALQQPTEVSIKGETISAAGTEDALIREYATGLGVTDAEIQSVIDREILEKGITEWRWTLSAMRALETRVPFFRNIGIGFFEQVDAYLCRPHITKAIDTIVSGALGEGPSVVVAHSLGTIVGYRVLRNASTTGFAQLFVTIGSPLGMNVVKDRLRPPPLKKPDGVLRWINASDPRDYVALYPVLDSATFAEEIENIADIQNSPGHAHSIGEYLRDSRLALAIYEALSS